MAHTADSDGEDAALGIFDAPEGFYEPEKQSTTVNHTTLAGQELTLRLVGHSPLWGHYIWQAALTISTYLETHASTLLHNKTVLELGAAAGLPSIIAALNGAKCVVATDYPDQDLVDILRHNLVSNCASQDRVRVDGYLWGADISRLLSYLPDKSNSTAAEHGFDVLILADLLFNHSEHQKLLSTILQTLRKPSSNSTSGTALVFFSPYRPHLLEADMAFFPLAEAGGLKVEKLLETKMEKVMFPEDRGDEEVRRTVFGFALTWAE
ncbi:Protein N-terminal and lysine N-methyltransferase efm7 [Saxophila tyrrhenica]|uniref:Protein N-terminal and lysine N-methyltransferase EFM7 n=1 Tax=Saxophila tyrrhenica TaxID=1690608 RepID=A0AAV9PC83_9PEZI|nr:Protein N-terminal and lysine N-methyltransferase efm7 [Saxophila tyrrhenica]